MKDTAFQIEPLTKGKKYDKVDMVDDIFNNSITSS